MRYVLVLILSLAVLFGIATSADASQAGGRDVVMVKLCHVGEDVDAETGGAVTTVNLIDVPEHSAHLTKHDLDYPAVVDEATGDYTCDLPEEEPTDI